MTALPVHSHGLPNIFGRLFTRQGRTRPKTVAFELTDQDRADHVKRLRDEQVYFGNRIAEFTSRGASPPSNLVESLAHNNQVLRTLGD